MKKIIIFSIIIIIIAVVVYQNYFKNEETDFTLATVEKGNVIQEVSETGQVKREEEVNLGFNLSGTIRQVYIEVGEEVKEQDVLAKLDDVQLRIQLEESKANLQLYQAQLNKLLTGSSEEDIQIAQTSVDNARISLTTAEQTLEDVKKDGEEDLKASYEDALNDLDDAYLKISNAFNTADLIQTTYFAINNQEGVRVQENKDKIGNARDRVKPYLDAAKSTKDYGDIDIALSETKTNLEIVANSLKIIRDTCEVGAYKSAVSSTHKSSLDTQRGYINTALTGIVDRQQAISSTKITNEININSYQGKVNIAEGALQAAGNNLAKITASPRQEDVDLYQAQVNQAQAKVRLLEKQIGDTVLKSPIDGQVIKINKKVGEIVQSALQNSIITILPDSPFKIEVDIYEEDIAQMKVGNPVDISLVAFPDDNVGGRVTFIDPSEKIIDGVVYYEASISLPSYPDGVKPGMTVDLIIRVDLKENVLFLPEEAITKRNGKYIVEMVEGDAFKEKEIEIGLEGSDNLVEIISGLREGEEVVVR
jgi:RND family efflux transporter MFP subunit